MCNYFSAPHPNGLNNGFIYLIILDDLGSEEFLALKPLSVTKEDGVLALRADLEGQKWNIGFVYCDGQWKIDCVDGFMPSSKEWTQRLLPLLRKRSTDHFDIYYFPGSTAEARIDQIAREREARMHAITELLSQPGKPVVQRMCLVLFESKDAKCYVTADPNDVMANGYTVAEVCNAETKWDPYYERTEK